MYSHYRPAPKRTRKKLSVHYLILGVLLCTGIGLGWHTATHTKSVTAASHQPPKTTQKTAAKPQPLQNSTDSPRATATTVQPKNTPCTGNTASKLIIVSISARHLWACAGSSQQYYSAVVTGMQNLAADLTPTGTYHIYGKQTDLHLKGSDSTGSWDDYVYYWMPFLHNQYGTYGFHDATWRNANDFGNIDPYSSQGSHGCVELPLATAKWIYNWAENGTTVSVVS